jgi:VWFA-related protein
MLKWLLVFLLASVTAALSLQTPSEAPSQAAPTFRAGTKLVEVDVIAKDKNGPAAGLRKEDFTLLDNGKPQAISVFSVKSAAPQARATAPLPAGVVSNRVTPQGETPGAATALILDQKNIPVQGQSFAIQGIVNFIAKRHKKDRIALYALQQNGLRVVQDLTDDDRLLRQAAQSLKPVKPKTCDGAGRECTRALLVESAMDTRHAFEAVARHFANSPGRKSAIWITTSFPLLIPAMSLDFTNDMKAAARVLGDANIALYSVDARGLSTTGRGIYPPGFETMDLLAGLTGGDVLINTNGIAEAIETAVREGDVVYTLGFYPPPDENEGAVHKLKVEAARKDLSLRYRESYVAAKAQPVTDPKTVEQLLKEPLDATQIELAAEAIPDAAHPGSFRVLVSVALQDVRFQQQGGMWTAELGFAFLEEGTEQIRVITRKLEFPDKELAANIARGTVVETSVAPKGSKGILRIAVLDHTTGAAGSLKLPLGGK